MNVQENLKSKLKQKGMFRKSVKLSECKEQLFETQALVMKTVQLGQPNQKPNKQDPIKAKTRTPSSMTSSNTAESHVIVAIAEGRGQARAVVGMAAVNVHRPTLILCQIHDTNNYVNTLTKINVFCPAEILMPITFVDNNQNNRLFVCVKKRFPQTTITAVSRREFNSSQGLQYVSGLCANEFSAVILPLRHK